MNPLETRGIPSRVILWVLLVAALVLYGFPFVYLILNEAGVKRLTAPRRYLKVLRPISLTHGDKRIALYPSDHFKVT